MSTNTNYTLEANTVLFMNEKEIKLAAVSMLHPTMQEACGEFEEIDRWGLFNLMRQLDVSRILLTEMEPICIAVEFSCEDPPLYYAIPWSDWSYILHDLCIDVKESVEDKFDWRLEGF